VEVCFTGEDGRTATFSFAALPLPGWHADLAAVFAQRTGPTGSVRTLATAQNDWAVIHRLLCFLGGLKHPPASPARLAVGHLRRFQLHRQRTCNPRVVANELRAVRLLLGHPSTRPGLRAEVAGWLDRRWEHPPRPGSAGYSEREFRQIMTAARSDTAAIRDRLHAAEQLLVRADAEPHTLSDLERAAAARLAPIAQTGQVPVLHRPGLVPPDSAAMVQLAGQLFVLDRDLAPLLVLGVGLSGRNGETIKELPAAHTLLEGRAVAVELTKRRRGPTRTREIVHWEVGPPSRQLHTPGGYYLLVCELTRRSRTFSGSASLWSVWLHRGGHLDPFAKDLSRHVCLNRWAQAHDLRGDDGQPLRLSLNRLRTTVEVRTAKATGGHLPTSARSNTMDVQFAHYLRGDPTVIDWAAEEVTAALHDAEQHARQAHLRVLVDPVEQLRADLAGTAARLGVATHTARKALDGALDTLAAACLDINHSPFSPGRCQASFLACLGCPNALVTQQHLPGLLALLEQLDAQRQATDADTWWARHGPTWLAITRDVLPRFTPAEVAHAQASTPAVTLLDLLGGPREPA